jgi:hypothetical protein
MESGAVESIRGLELRERRGALRALILPRESVDGAGGREDLVRVRRRRIVAEAGEDVALNSMPPGPAIASITAASLTTVISSV